MLTAGHFAKKLGQVIVFLAGKEECSLESGVHLGPRTIGWIEVQAALGDSSFRSIFQLSKAVIWCKGCTDATSGIDLWGKYEAVFGSSDYLFTVHGEVFHQMGPICYRRQLLKVIMLTEQKQLGV